MTEKQLHNAMIHVAKEAMLSLSVEFSLEATVSGYDILGLVRKLGTALDSVPVPGEQ